MLRKKNVVSSTLFVSLLIGMILFSSCAPAATQAPAPAEKKVVVGLVMKSLANEFFKIMQEATVTWAATQPNIDLRPVGMNSETDIDTQFAAVENFVTQDVDLIVVAAADSVGMVAPVKKAVDAGIVVVNFDVKLDTAALKAAGLPEDFLFVGPDNREGAKLAGDAMGEALGKGGKVIIIEGNPGADNATQRRLGFEDSVAEYGLELLDSKTAHWETEEANTVVSNLLTKYPDVQGIMCANDSMVLGAVKAIEAAGLNGKVLVVGFDNIPAVQDLIKEGKVLATVDQFGPDMAKNAIEVGLRILDGEKLTGWIKTPVQLVDATTLGASAPAAPTTEEVTITWFRLAEWSAADPSIIKTFEASHPGIKVKVEEVPFSEFVNQINLRFGAGDTSIDVISADGPLVASYGYRGWLLPLDGVYSEAELADFLPSSLAAGTYDGKLIAGPVSTSTQLLYYNADVFKAAGVTPPGEDERWTWEQVAEAAQKVQVVDADGNVSTWGFQWEQTTAPYQLLPLAGSYGGQYIGEDGLTVDGVINSEPWIKGATFYSDMYNKYKVAPQSDAVGAPDLFVNGNLAMVIAGPWQISNFGTNAEFEWGVSRHPYFEGEEIVTTTGGWHIAVNSVSEHPEAAKEFARWLSTGEGAEMWWRIGSHDMPAQKSILEMFATNEEFNEKPLYYNRVASQEAAVNPVSRPVTVGFLEYDQIYRDTFQDIRTGTDPTEALNTMVDRLNSELAKYR